LSGDGTRTPVIHELDLFGPRRSTLTDLPTPFHQDPESAHFLDRFLSYFDTVFAEITTRNREIATLFDPDTVSDDGFLTWLGAWFDLRFLAEWSESTRREMIREAIAYFRKRGTVDGLRQIVQWHTGLDEPLPQIIEHFRLPTGPGAGPPPMIGGELLEAGSAAHRFTLVLPASTIPDEVAGQRLSALVAASIPAHCRFQIRAITPGVTIGSQSSIGVDTLLGSLDPSGLGMGLLGGTFSTPGPAPIGPVAHYANSQSSPINGDYRC
jgi:phage tail-like protein